jgi:cytochrome c
MSTGARRGPPGIGRFRQNVMVAAALALAGSALGVHADPLPAELAKDKKCLNCHALDQKLVGPAFKAVAARYATDKDAEDRLAKKIREGGSGVWGVVPMPSNDVTAAQAKQLAHWVLQQT